MVTENSFRDMLLVFAKYPQPGRVKTRLARDIGTDRAVRVYCRLVETVIHNVRSGTYGTRVVYAPRGTKQRLRAWLGELPGGYRLQRGTGLGERLAAAAIRAKAEGARSVALIGTDCPFITAGMVEYAFNALQRKDAVIIPTEDGGYCLLAFRTPHPALFAGIDWSTDRVCRQTLEQAARAGLTVEKMPALFDIDTVDDLARWEKTA